MAADLFESYAVMLVAALILGKVAFGNDGLVFPLIVPMIGVITAVIGIFVVAPRKSDRSGMTAINRGLLHLRGHLAGPGHRRRVPLPAVALQRAQGRDRPAAILRHGGSPRWLAIGAVVIGLVLASAIQLLTGYFTETNRKPVREIGESSETGAATVILSGISVGLESAVYSALLIGGAVYGAFLLGTGNATIALFAVALAGTGLLTTVGVIVSMDTFGPVSDNAQGIAEMSGEFEGEPAEILTHLDAIGNTTKAITKGIAIATAVLAATALFGAFRTSVVSALGKAGGHLQPVHRPSERPGRPHHRRGGRVLLRRPADHGGGPRGRPGGPARSASSSALTRGSWTTPRSPSTAAVVDICTRDSLRELATPGLLAVLTPIAVGFAFGYAPLGSYLAGAIAAGVLMAVFLANSGGAWDNAKKLVEDGNYGGKGSEAHEATIIGDTVGDPFKDTAGPAINPLIKVMNLVSLLIATSVVKYSDNDGLRAGVAVVAVIIIVAAVLFSKRRTATLTAGTPEAAVGAVAGPGPSVEPDADSEAGGTTAGGTAAGENGKTAAGKTST